MRYPPPAFQLDSPDAKHKPMNQRYAALTEQHLLMHQSINYPESANSPLLPLKQADHNNKQSINNNESADKSLDNNNASHQSFASNAFKLSLLVALVFRNSASTIVIRYSQGVLHEKYSVMSTILCAELVKMIVCTIGVMFGTSCSPARFISLLRTSLPMALPAVIYLMQNKLNYIALRSLPGAEFTILLQLKLLATAILARVVLGKLISGAQWRALMLLFVGVILVQSTSQSFNRPSQRVEHSAYECSWRVPDESVWAYASHFYCWSASFVDHYTGVSAAIAQAILSSLGCIYTERLLKGATKLSLWESNWQLSLYSMIVGIVYFYQSGSQTSDLFDHYSIWAVSSVIIQSVGGLLVSLILMHLDSIMKNFSSSVGMLVTSGASMWMFSDYPVSLLTFACGSSVVILAVFAYSDGTVQPSQPSQPTSVPVIEQQQVVSVVVPPPLTILIRDKARSRVSLASTDDNTGSPMSDTESELYSVNPSPDIGSRELLFDSLRDDQPFILRSQSSVV